MSKISAKTRYVQLTEWLKSRGVDTAKSRSPQRRFNNSNNRTRK